MLFLCRGSHNHILMENIVSTCTLGIRVRAASHQQEQVSYLTTKTLFRPQQMHRAQDFSYGSFFSSSAWVLVFLLFWWIVGSPSP